MPSWKRYKTATVHKWWVYQHLIQWDYKTPTMTFYIVSFKAPWCFKGRWIFYCYKWKLAQLILSSITAKAATYSLPSIWLLHVIRMAWLQTSYCSIHTRVFIIDETAWCGWLIWLMLVVVFFFSLSLHLARVDISTFLLMTISMSYK